MLKRLSMPLFISPTSWKKLGLRKHFDDYVSKFYGFHL